MPRNPGAPLFGVDFTSSPRPGKPITVAHGRRIGDRVELQSLTSLPTFTAFEALLVTPGPWLGAFDFPFGLPRELVLQLGWPQTWPALIRHYASLSRQHIRAVFKAFCAGRPSGHKFAHRHTDRPAGASPSMKWVNPPVAWMLHAGAPRLLAAGVHLPGLHPGDRRRTALEAYPGLLARAVLGRRSYKSDDGKRQTAERAAARRELVAALVAGRHPLALQLSAPTRLLRSLRADARGDRLDAVLALMQAAAAAGAEGYGLPRDVDPLEGWIATA